MSNIDVTSDLTHIVLESSNKKPVSDFVNYIRENLTLSTKSWKLIAAALYEASEMYGSDSDSYKRLLKETGFHKSKASKLVAIASSERLRRYETQLHCVHSWNTLYEITTLSDAQFDSLCLHYNLDSADAYPFLTEAQVKAFKRVETAKSPFKRFAYVMIDEDALKGQLLDGSILETLHATLKTLEDLSPFIKILETGVDDTESSLFMQQVSDKLNSIIRNKLKRICDRKLSTTTVRRRKGHTAEQHFAEVWGISRQELFRYVSDGEPQKAFSYLGAADEYSESKFWNAAIDEVYQSRAKFIERARARANTADTQIA